MELLVLYVMWYATQSVTDKYSLPKYNAGV